MDCVVDTNIFNRLIDGALSTGDLPANARMVATHIQMDELTSTRNVQRRAQQVKRFETLVDDIVPTESFILDISRLGEAKLGDGRLYGSLLADLDRLNGGKPNNTQDALIAEVAISNRYLLLAADNHLAMVARKYGCDVRLFPS
jgi:predicted nucleic acid-binding protein